MSWAAKRCEAGSKRMSWTARVAGTLGRQHQVGVADVEGDLDLLVGAEIVAQCVLDLLRHLIGVDLMRRARDQDR